LSKELGKLDARVAELHRQLEELEATRTAVRDQLALLVRFTPDDDSPFPERSGPGKGSHLQPVQDANRQTRSVLHGSRIREVAVLLLASSPNPKRPIHYQQWYEMLRQAGYGIDAQDPLATFLTQISRSPVVRRAGAAGVYAIDFEAPLRLREQLFKLTHELAHTTIAGETAEDVAAARERRTKLTTETRRVERMLEEALRSLGDHPQPD
jgi:hypothetical protein